MFDEWLDDGSASPSVPVAELPAFYRAFAARLRRNAGRAGTAPEFREQILKSARSFDDLAERVAQVGCASRASAEPPSRN
jgi:hypothetical protein